MKSLLLSQSFGATLPFLDGKFMPCFETVWGKNRVVAMPDGLDSEAVVCLLEKSVAEREMPTAITCMGQVRTRRG